MSGSDSKSRNDSPLPLSEVMSSPPEQGDPNARPSCFRNLFEEIIFVFTVMMAIACTTFLQGVIVINTATIGESLDMQPAQITWIAAALG